MLARTGRGCGDGGAGVVSTAVGMLVFLMFLFLAMQVMFGLYATSTLRATLADAASRAASRGGSPDELDRAEHDARDALGEIGRRPSTVVDLELVDADGDGVADTVAGRAQAVPPRFVPASVGGMLGFDRITASARVRVERPQ
jgi:Flp pilus assembly protein TadG